MQEHSDVVFVFVNSCPGPLGAEAFGASARVLSNVVEGDWSQALVTCRVGQGKLINIRDVGVSQDMKEQRFLLVN